MRHATFQKCFTKCLTNSHAKLQFLVLFIKTKFISMNRFIIPSLVNPVLFQENPFQTLGNMRAQICQYLQRNVCQGAGATGYCSNYCENQTNKLIIINQSTYCYSFTSLSNIAEKKIKRTVIIQNVVEIFNMLLSI